MLGCTGPFIAVLSNNKQTASDVIEELKTKTVNVVGLRRIHKKTRSKYDVSSSGMPHNRTAKDTNTTYEVK